MFDWWKRRMRRPSPPLSPVLPIAPALFEQDGASLYGALSRHWASSDPHLYRLHAIGADIDALEQRYSLRLPDDFRAYLRHAVPAETFMDDFGTQWWGLRDIKPLSVECRNWKPGNIGRAIARESDRYLVFSDYLIWCYAWAICCSDGPNRGRVALIGGRPDMFVAEDFRTFVRLALVDDTRIHGGPAKRAKAKR